MDYRSFAIDWDYGKETARSGPAEMEAINTIRKTIFEGAARRWKNAFEDWPLQAQLLIRVEFESFDAKREAAARVKPSSIKFMDHQGSKFPIEGTITIDLAEKNALLARRAEFLDVVTHEIGHVLGIGMLLDEFGGRKRIKQGSNRSWYVGEHAKVEYAHLLGLSADDITGVPIQIEKDGTAFHWDDAYLDWELLSANLEGPEVGGSPGAGLNALSRVTLGALKDLGYNVNLENAEHFALSPPIRRWGAFPAASARTAPSTSRCRVGV